MSNRSLAQAGAREQIISFTEASVSAINCNLLFQPTFEQLGRAAHWNCLRNGPVPLTLLKAAQGTPENQTGSILPIPPQPWLYEYLLPNDCLAVRFLQPTFLPQAGSVPIFPTPSALAPTLLPRQEIPFVVSTDIVSGTRTKVILTNLALAQIVYTLNEPNPDFWDSQFQAAYVASLAAFLIPPLNLNMGLLNMQIKIANQIIQEARSADGNEGVVSQNREASWIVARGAGEWAGSGYGCGYQEYGQMSWPSGGD